MSTTRTTDECKVYLGHCSTHGCPSSKCPAPRTTDLKAKLREAVDQHYVRSDDPLAIFESLALTAARLALLEGARLAYDGIPEPWTDKFGNYHTDGLHAWPAFADYLSALARDLGGGE